MKHLWTFALSQVASLQFDLHGGLGIKHQACVRACVCVSACACMCVVFAHMECISLPHQTLIPHNANTFYFIPSRRDSLTNNSRQQTRCGSSLEHQHRSTQTCRHRKTGALDAGQDRDTSSHWACQLQLTTLCGHTNRHAWRGTRLAAGWYLWQSKGHKAGLAENLITWFCVPCWQQTHHQLTMTAEVRLFWFFYLTVNKALQKYPLLLLLYK